MAYASSEFGSQNLATYALKGARACACPQTFLVGGQNALRMTTSSWHLVAQSMRLRRTYLLVLTSVIFGMLVACKRIVQSPLTTLCCPANIFSKPCSLNTMANLQRLDLVRMTVADIQNLMKSGNLTSVDLVKETLAQIERHNLQGLKLRAVISTAPENLVLETAARLDAERAKGETRGPFHGLPILVKVSYFGL